MRPVPEIIVFGKPTTTYYFLGLVGLACCVLFLGLLSLTDRYALLPFVYCFLAALFVSYSFNVIRSFIYPEESYTFYHYYLLVGLTISLVGWYTGNELLPLLDAFVICSSILGGIGRIGCYHAGCCYGKEVKCQGKTKRFPIQLLDSGLQLFNVVAGITLLLLEVKSGIVFVSLTLSFAFGRFLIEFMRGDKRNSYFSVSEAQYTATTLTLVLVFIVPFIWVEGIVMARSVFAILILLLLKQIIEFSLKRKHQFP